MPENDFCFLLLSCFTIVHSLEDRCDHLVPCMIIYSFFLMSFPLSLFD